MVFRHCYENLVDKYLTDVEKSHLVAHLSCFYNIIKEPLELSTFLTHSKGGNDIVNTVCQRFFNEFMEFLHRGDIEYITFSNEVKLHLFVFECGNFETMDNGDFWSLHEEAFKTGARESFFVECAEYYNRVVDEARRKVSFKENIPPNPRARKYINLRERHA